MKKISFSQKLRYAFDNTMSKGAIALIGWLAVLSLLVVIIAAVIITILQVAPEGEEPMGFIEAVWRSLMRTLDPGTMGGDAGWGFRLIAFMVTLGGIFIISTLIGVLSSGIESKLEELRKGRSFVVEENHVLILGWSSKIFAIISELVIANENLKKGRIVILSNKDKVEMEDEIKSKITNTRNTKIICRNGNPGDLTDLEMVNPQHAKSIIVLSDETDNPDVQTIKVILALVNSKTRKETPYHIVAEIKEPKNLEVARMVGKGETELILTDDVIARVMVQTSRQSGLSIVYTELMDFDGAEIYFNEEPKLVGKTYAEALMAYKDSAVMGVYTKDGVAKVNPPMNTRLSEGDQVIAITEDDDTLVISDYIPTPQKIQAITADNQVAASEKTLLLGWNARAKTIIREMDNYVAQGSYLNVVSSFAVDVEELKQIASGLQNIHLDYRQADTTSRQVLDELQVYQYNQVQLLSYKEALSAEDADAHSLITLLHLRNIAEEANTDLKIVSEMLDVRNRELAEVTKADDFIVSDKLISLLMTQVAENKHLMRVFEDLLDADGSEIYLKPATTYVPLGQPVDFYSVLESAIARNETAIGYRITALSHESDKGYGVVVNPVKTEKITFGKEDMIIVLAEN